MHFKTVDAGRGAGWLGDGWNLVKGQLGTWILLIIIYVLIELVLQLIPFIGGILAALISPGLVAGLYLAARYVDEGKNADINLLFEPLKNERTRGPLLTLGAMAIVFSILIALVVMMMFGGAISGMAEMEKSGDVSAETLMASGMMSMGLGGFLLVFLLVAVYSMAMWFAAPLVLFAGVAPIESMKISFKAVLSNWLPALVFGVIMLALGFIASIPLLLGWLLLLPVFFAAVYVSYKDVFDVRQENDAQVIEQPGMASSSMKM